MRISPRIHPLLAYWCGRTSFDSHAGASYKKPSFDQLLEGASLTVGAMTGEMPTTVPISMSTMANPTMVSTQYRGWCSSGHAGRAAQCQRLRKPASWRGRDRNDR